jgi:hypothetical protein
VSRDHDDIRCSIDLRSLVRVRSFGDVATSGSVATRDDELIRCSIDLQSLQRVAVHLGRSFSAPVRAPGTPALPERTMTVHVAPPHLSLHKHTPLPLCYHGNCAAASGKSL